ncbi:MAG TPA: SDR family NAD(P)-dependent oxidoreductase [Nitrospinaceae bacterium]|nr:SDR family NAD(P)-dependent oxidoreductase [Nitrospinaceae bacterium]|tara:strand:- start:227 stop:406 length:180 start_codon:yes stop_codon:yes gene_type:complete
MSRRLEGKVAAITGAASGFGAGATRRFIEEGGKVVMGDIQDDAGQWSQNQVEICASRRE